MKGVLKIRKVGGRIALRFYVLLAVAAAILVYGVYYAYDRLAKKTAIIQAGDTTGQYKADVVIARDERITDSESWTSVQYYADEGAFVYQGSRIADVYAAGYSKTDENKLLSIRSQIKANQKAMPLYADQQLDRLNGQVLGYAGELEMLVQQKHRGNLLNLERQLKDTLAIRQNYLTQKFSTDQTLRGLYENEATLVKKIESWTNNYLASSDCIVSFYTDGYESMLAAQDIDHITASQVRSVLNGEDPILSTAQRGRVAVYREVSPNGFYLLMLSHDAKWNPIDGNVYKVELKGFEDSIYDATVISSSRTGNELLVRMYVEGDVRTVLNSRVTTAVIGEVFVSGLQVPIRALLTQGGEVGVVVTNDGGRFIPVQVIDHTQEYAIIQPLSPGLLSEGQKVRVF